MKFVWQMTWAYQQNSTHSAFPSYDKNQMKMYEDQIDQLEEVLHERHIHRVNAGYCSFTNTEHYVEILSNIERIGDHLNNILDSIAVKEYSKYDEFNH